MIRKNDPKDENGDPGANGDWGEYRRLVLAEIKSIRKSLDDIEREMVEFREVRDEWRRYQWIMGFVRQTTLYVGGIVGLIWSGRDVIARIWKAITS